MIDMVNEELLQRTFQVFVDTARVAAVENIGQMPDDASFFREETVNTQLPDSFADIVEREPVRTENQPIILDEIRETTSRFSGALWYNKIQEQSIIVGGQGGISSWFTFLAARMFPACIYTFDPDKVERVNLAGQLFSKNQVGMYKGDAVSDTVNQFSEYRSVFSVNEFYTSESNAGKIMVCGFDNMEARKVFYYNWKAIVCFLPEEERSGCLFIDGRLAAESLQILCITGDSPWDMEKYEEKYLFGDKDADTTVCSFKQTAFMANMIAGLMINMLVNFCANLCGGCRTIPFYTQYEADQMYFKLEGGI